MAHPKRRTQTVSRSMMKSCCETRPTRAIHDQDLLDWRLSPQVETLVDKPLEGRRRLALRGGVHDLEFEILILPPNPRLLVDAASTRRKAIHRAFCARVKPLHVGRFVEMENQREVLRRARAVEQIERAVQQRHSYRVHWE